MLFSNENSSLKEIIEEARNKILKGINHLEKLEIELDKKDNKLWNEVIKSFENNDSIKANSLAKELFEIRKLKKIIQNKKQDLEIISTKLLFIKEFEDITKTLTPINKILKDFNKSIPNSINEIHNIIETNIIINEIPIFYNEEVEKILNEAAMIAKLRKENSK
ncbi:MAG: hypothetical protein QXW62_03180 [Candidatus Methanomethylicaceae archaeon]|nr:hypothetical protein [Candidatus Verstraetearchaeota archaeon]